MVQPRQGSDEFNKGKKEFRRSMKKREKVDLFKIRKHRMLQRKQEEEQEEAEEIEQFGLLEDEKGFLLSDSSSNVSDKTECKSTYQSETNLRRFSKILDAPQSIMEYKDLIKSISLQLFSKSNSSSVNKSPRSAKYTPFGTGKDVDDNDTLERTIDSTEEEIRTRNFVLTQKFIGWKV